METVIHAAKQAKEKGLIVLLNPAPARNLSDELIRVVDYIVPNETELGLLSGKPVNDLASIEEAGRTLLSRGVKNIIVTLGEKGAMILNKEGIKLIPSFKVKVVDTTAAGDAFIGGMAVGLMNGKSLEDAVQYGCACGSLAVTKFGAQPSMPTLEEVNKLLTR